MLNFIKSYAKMSTEERLQVRRELSDKLAEQFAKEIGLQPEKREMLNHIMKSLK